MKRIEINQAYTKDGQGQHGKLEVTEMTDEKWFICLRTSMSIMHGPYFDREATLRLRDFLNELLGNPKAQPSEEDEFKELISKYK